MPYDHHEALNSLSHSLSLKGWIELILRSFKNTSTQISNQILTIDFINLW